MFAFAIRGQLLLQDCVQDSEELWMCRSASQCVAVCIAACVAVRHADILYTVLGAGLSRRGGYVVVCCSVLQYVLQCALQRDILTYC